MGRIDVSARTVIGSEVDMMTEENDWKLVDVRCQMRMPNFNERSVGCGSKR